MCVCICVHTFTYTHIYIYIWTCVYMLKAQLQSCAEGGSVSDRYVDADSETR